MAGVFECGFSRVAVRESLRDFKVKDNATRQQKYISFFEDDYRENFDVSLKTFSKRSTVLTNLFNKWQSEEKSRYIEHFSNRSWSKLSLYQKAAHSATNCRACEVYHKPLQDTFPVRCNRLKQRNLKDIATKEIKKQKSVEPTQAAIKETVRDVYKKINEPFKEIFNVNFNEALVKVPELKIQHKQSVAKRKQQQRERNVKQKKAIQEQWATRDVTAFLGTRQSFSQRDRQRKALFYETREEASARVEKRKAQEHEGERIPKRHSPDPSNVDFDKVGLLERVNGMSDGEKVFLYFLVHIC